MELNNYFSCYQVNEGDELRMMGILQDSQERAKESEMEAVEEEEEDELQIFGSHEALSETFRKSMYYGSSLPSRDRPSLAMTELFVDELDRFKASHQSLDRLGMEKASQMSVSACASPTSFLLALVYIERLRDKNPDYLKVVSSADLFLISMMVASKFLNDDGEEDEVFNDEWAASAGLEKKELNNLEIEFLTAIDWRVFVDPSTFTDMKERVERKIADKRLRARDWNAASYTDLWILLKTENWELYLYSLKLALIGISAYVTSVLTLLGTCYLLNKTPLHPSAALARLTSTSSSASSTSSSSPSSHNSSSSSSFVIEYNAIHHSTSSSPLILDDQMITNNYLDEEELNVPDYSMMVNCVTANRRRLQLSSPVKKKIFHDENEILDVEIDKGKLEKCITNPFLINGLSINSNHLIST